MIKLTGTAAGALLLATLGTAPALAQNDGTYNDEPPAGNNTPCDYTFLCNLFGDEPSDGSGSSGTGIDLIDDIVDWVDETKDKYDADQAEKARQEAEEFQRRQEEIAQKIAEDEERARLALNEEEDRQQRLDELGDVGEAVKDYAKVENNLWEQAHRVFADNRSFAFAGGGQNEGGSIGYRGFYDKGYIAGTYDLFDNEDQELYSGTFAGTSTRSGRVSGTYYNPQFQERGSFSGQMSENLDKLFSGGIRCTSNCDDDD